VYSVYFVVFVCLLCVCVWLHLISNKGMHIAIVIFDAAVTSIAYSVSLNPQLVQGNLILYSSAYLFSLSDLRPG